MSLWHNTWIKDEGMRVIMYGAQICPDCVEAKVILAADTTIELDYRDITANTKTLKEFLLYRDHDTIFAPIIEEGKIGIPFFILEDGTGTFEINDFIRMGKPVQAVSTCSMDGKGHC